ncbi:MAG: hypothetical protein ACR2H3_11460 [Acidimicrobiales bacterium]
MSSPTLLDDSNVVFLFGELSAEPRQRSLPSGDVLVEFDVTTRGVVGTCSTPVAWFLPDSTGPASTVDAMTAGASVAVAGHVRRRFFRSGGATMSRTEVVADAVVAAPKAAALGRLRKQVAAAALGST